MLRSMSGCNGGGSGVSASCSWGGGGGGSEVVVVVGGPIRVVPLVGGLVLDTAIQEASSPLVFVTVVGGVLLSLPRSRRSLHRAVPRLLN